MTWLLFVSLALATWRISNMLVFEYGPFGLFMWIRKLFGIMHTREGIVLSYSHKNVLSCVWCTSVWIAIVLLALRAWWSLSEWIIYAMALSAIACFMSLLEGALSKHGRS